MDKVSYNKGAHELGGSLHGDSQDALSTGFTNITPAKRDPWDADYVRQDDGGTNSVGDRCEFRKTGACGRPNGNER